MKQSRCLATSAAIVLVANFLIGGVTVAAHCDSESVVDPTSRVLWMNLEHTQPVFIPEALLIGQNLSSAPLSPSERSAIDSRVDKRLYPERFAMKRPVPCESNATLPGQGTEPNAGGIEDVLVEYEVIFRGTITRVVSGWSPWQNDVTKAAYLRVTEVLKGSNVAGAPKQARLVAVLFVGGHVKIGSTELCTSEYPGYYSPAAGDELLVAGFAWPEDDLFFNAAIRFPIKAGEVQPQPLPGLRQDAQAVPFGVLVRRMVE